MPILHLELCLELSSLCPYCIWSWVSNSLIFVPTLHLELGLELSSLCPYCIWSCVSNSLVFVPTLHLELDCANIAFGVGSRTLSSVCPHYIWSWVSNSLVCVPTLHLELGLELSRLCAHITFGSLVFAGGTGRRSRDECAGVAGK